MKSAIAILTYRRVAALEAFMRGLEEHCPQYRCAIFEDCGQRDDTADILQRGRVPLPDPDLMATRWLVADNPDTAPVYPNASVFLGDRNLGVAGNSNRALRWFMQTDCDHLCLCNDDLLANGNFVASYARGHEDLGVEMFCFCDFDKASPAISGSPESYKWVVYPWRGYRVKMLPRMTGIMMSVTRMVVDKIGYFDAEFGQFGEEHCDYTIRARFAGCIRLGNQDMNCLDLEQQHLTHQDVPSSLSGVPRKHADEYARRIMSRASFEYRFRHYYRPYRLVYPAWAGAYYGSGIPCRQLEQIGYRIVTALA